MTTAEYVSDRKRRQMQRDNGCELLNERFLFHGTSRNTVDAICANNFDWRLCGSHGTVYGQGRLITQLNLPLQLPTLGAVLALLYNK